MNGAGLEVLLEGLVPDIAYSGEKGVSVSELLKIVRKYHRSAGLEGASSEGDVAGGPSEPIPDGDLESSFTEAELNSARWAWGWLRSRPQILIGGNKRWNRLELSEVLALPEAKLSPAAAVDGQASVGGPAATPQKSDQKSKKTLTTRPRIHPSEDLVWQTLTRHGVDYKRVPVLEWKCLLGIASVKGEGILQSDLRRLVDQDKRSLPKRTDSLAKKGYIAKRTIVVQKMKTSKLWLIDFAPPILESETGGLDLSKETLTKDLEPVAWHTRWTGNNIDMEAFGKTFVAIIKAWGVIRYSDLRYKMGVGGKQWQMKTLSKNSQRFVDMGVLKYTAASFPGTRKVFKDCLKFVRDPRPEEWEKFLATGKKTSQYSDATRHREPKPNALALYGKSSGENEESKDESGKKPRRIFPGWIPEKPLAQNVFEVIRSAGPEGASNPQVSVATVGYGFRRYMASHLTKVAETQQPAHLKKFQIVSRLVRKGKTSAYMFSVQEPEATPKAPDADATTDQTEEAVVAQNGPSASTGADAYGFGSIRTKAFSSKSNASLSDLARLARKPGAKRKHLFSSKAERMAEGDDVSMVDAITEPVQSETPVGKEPAPKPVSEEIEQVHHEEEEEPVQLRRGRQPRQRPEEDNGDDQGAAKKLMEEIHIPVESEPATIKVLPEPSPKITELLPGKPPGAYIGIPGSLNPIPKKKGRPRQSSVIIIKSEKLKRLKLLESTDAVDQGQSAGDVGSNEVEAPRILLNVRYHGISGQLELNQVDRALTFVRTEGRAAKQPLTIGIDSILDDLSIRNVPGGDDKCLVFVTGDAEEANTSLSYTFTFEANEQNQRNALAIQQEVVKLKPGQAVGDVIVAVPSTPSGDIEEDTPPRSGATRGRGRGRGGRGRGRGGGGRSKKSQPVGGGAKVHKCDLCGGTWKNDIGLKYHLTKGQTECNPNFDPAELLERSRRKRKLSPAPAPPTPAAASDADGETPSKRLRQLHGTHRADRPPAPPRPEVRKALRPRQDPGFAFRGFAVEDFTAPAVETPRGNGAREQEKARRPTGMGMSYFVDDGDDESPESGTTLQDPDQMDVDDSNQVNGRLDSTAQGKSIDAVGAASETAKVADLAQPKPASQVLSAKKAIMSAQIQPKDATNGKTPEKKARAGPKSGRPRKLLDPLYRKEAEYIEGEERALTSQDAQQTARSEPEKRADEPPVSKPSNKEPIMIEDDEEIVDGSADEETSSQHGQASHIKPFKPSTDYDRMATEAKKRTAQAFDIISYLLDSNCGVFPGDKALFYALTKVFLQEFRNQIPPTWNNCYSAIKAMEARKHATVHTHMLKTERGKLVTFSMLVKAGVDPAGMIPTFMKQKMRDTYPCLYIPTAFSPTKEELVLLQELDNPQKPTKVNANGQKFRSRRKIDEVEVFNAPYYTQNASVTPSASDPLRARHSEQPMNTEGRKRSAFDELPGSPLAKRARVGVLESRSRDKESGAADGGRDDSDFMDQDSEYAPSDYEEILPPPRVAQNSLDHKLNGNSEAPHNREMSHSAAMFAPKMRRSKKTATAEAKRRAKAKPKPNRQQVLDGNGLLNGEPTSVIEAIKAYGLLPVKTGKRGVPKPMPRVKKMIKLPIQLGRARNPGLASLPSLFFKNDWLAQTRSEFRFLLPNTLLEDAVGESGDESERESSSYASTPVATPKLLPQSSGDEPQVPELAPKPAPEPAPEVAPEPAPEDEDREKGDVQHEFAPLTLVNANSRGSWDDLGNDFFEANHEKSLSIQGWMPSRRYLLSQNLPHSAQEMAQRAAAGNWRVTRFLDRNWGKFCAVVQRCLSWELSMAGTALLTSGSVAPDYIYINVSPPEGRSKMKPTTLQWPDETQFTLETLPYGDLDDDVDDDDELASADDNRGWNTGNLAEPRPFKKRRVTTKVPQRKTGVGGRPTKFKLQAIKTGRELTAYPISPDDFLRIPGDEKEELDWTSENTRLTSFIVVTTLLGGVDRVVDWGLMMRLYPDLTLSQLRHAWCALKKDRQSTIISLTDKFRHSFIKAYAANELPPIDFNNTAAYDWKALIKWTEALDEFERVDLPASRTFLESEYALSDIKFENREWRESYYHVQRSVFNRFQDATSEALSMPIDQGNRKDPRVTLDSQLVVGMSWTRSLSVTPVDRYSVDVILRKRNNLFPGLTKSEITDIILKGIDQLQRDGVISKSTAKWSNGRRWRFNNRVPETLEKVAHEDRLAQAVAYKKELDDAFAAGETKKRVKYITNDGMIMALLNMQAQGRVRIETTGQPNVPMGHEPGNYETRKYPKKYLHFRIDVAPTDTYLYNDSDEITELRRRVEAANPPNAGPEGAIPVWCDVLGRVDPKRWVTYLSAVLVTIASRGAMPADELVKTIKPVIMLFEVELIMEWAAKLGILKPQLEGGAALAAMEWWWLTVQVQKDRAETVPKPRKALPSGRRVVGAADQEAAVPAGKVVGGEE
ncbi:hypothetical protein B0T19DRAFT_421287 [Cercophora scortea]|uniref:Uncharacterized protein n=1 Tax=Cercophora scortea TaxID=314031 RepID=A0AAE0ILF4_9PEZI|nr:hypothetical protein B0T19DRAFT_421287 [Cercophora scortea]